MHDGYVPSPNCLLNDKNDNDEMSMLFFEIARRSCARAEGRLRACELEPNASGLLTDGN
jgi:hypothetical protein